MLQRISPKDEGFYVGHTFIPAIPYGLWSVMERQIGQLKEEHERAVQTKDFARARRVKKERSEMLERWRRTLPEFETILQQEMCESRKKSFQPLLILRNAALAMLLASALSAVMYTLATYSPHEEVTSISMGLSMLAYLGAAILGYLRGSWKADELLDNCRQNFTRRYPDLAKLLI